MEWRGRSRAPLDRLPFSPDGFPGDRFSLLVLDPPTPGHLRGNHEVEAWAKMGLTFPGLGLAMNPDALSQPGLNRFEFINHQGNLGLPSHHIFVLARGGDVMTADVEVRPIKGEANGVHRGVSIRGDGADPGNPLRSQERQLLFGKHNVSPFYLSCQSRVDLACPM